MYTLSMQLPIPPGLSVYGEPADEATSNIHIYESIDLQREYINPYHQAQGFPPGYTIHSNAGQPLFLWPTSVVQQCNRI